MYKRQGHTGSTPWATSKSINLPASVAARGAKNCVFSAQNCFICLPAVLVRNLVSFAAPPLTALPPPSWLSPMSLGSKIDAYKKMSISGATAFRLPRHRPPAPRPTLPSCARAAVTSSIELVCCTPQTWAVTQGVQSVFKN